MGDPVIRRRDVDFVHESIERLVDSVADGKEPEVTLDDGVHVSKVSLAILESAKMREPVKVIYWLCVPTSFPNSAWPEIGHRHRSVSWLGISFARGLRQGGCNLVIAARDFERLHGVAQDLEQYGGAVLPCKADAALVKDAEAVVDRAMEKFVAARYAGKQRRYISRR